MGFLRLILALSVVIDHLSPIFGNVLIGPRMAVQSFFIMSGFYMALVINEKYALLKHSYKLFITNRFLRIYPIYWLVLVCTAIFFSSGQRPTLLTIVKNIFLFPSVDYAMYLPKLYGGLVVFQAWTLGLELQFYLVAPFIVKISNRVLLLLILASVVSRIYFTHPVWFYPEPLIDSFIATEAIFFLMGVAAYKIYGFIKNIKIDPKVLRLAFGGFMIFTLGYQYIFAIFDKINPFFPRTLEWAYYLGLMFCMPVIFVLMGINKWDKLAGDLSFPTYIAHTLVISILVYLGMAKSNNLDKIAAIVIILVVAYGLNKYVAMPIEKFRQKRASC
jgi:peptidoglycan/LPS O-acetylase OafA/YrhL